MATYEITSGAAIVLFLLLCFLQVVMRGQVHRAKYGNEEVNAWDPRFVSGLLGQYGIWKSHKQLYRRSVLRSMFLVTCAGLIACIVVTVYRLIHVR
jgi:uncharacterized membrane protein YdcZ (DUF606 family)